MGCRCRCGPVTCDNQRARSLFVFSSQRGIVSSGGSVTWARLGRNQALREALRVERHEVVESTFDKLLSGEEH